MAGLGSDASGIALGAAGEPVGATGAAAPGTEWWRVQVELLEDSGGEDLVMRRALNFWRAAAAGAPSPQEGQPWSFEILGAILEAARPNVAHPLPPPPFGEPQPLALSLPPTEDTALAPFEWAWWSLPIPWLDGDRQLATFALPVARLQEPWRGCRVLLSASALWHLLPDARGAGVAGLLNAKNENFWSFARKFGLDPAEIVPSKRALAMAQKSEDSSGALYCHR
eukprot:7542936-Alexandrium_andersonii.AAC.1